MIDKTWEKLWFFLFFIGAVLCNLTYAQDFDIKSYDISANIKIDGTIDVNEKIDTYFYNSKHWIERFFPKHYEVQDMEFQILYDNIKVNSDNYQNFDEYDEVYTRIWDADKTIIWEHLYDIDYSTYWLIKNYSWMWYSELYWNVIWYDWGNNIEKTNIVISLPVAYTWFTDDDFLISAWYSNNFNISEFAWNITRDENHIYITYNKTLTPYNWITLAIKFPNNYFEYDHEKQADLFVWYTHDYNIKNYKLYGNVSETWNISFSSNTELEILNEYPYINGYIPYKYRIDDKKYPVILNNVVVNWKQITTKENNYDTSTVVNKWFIVDWELPQDNIISWEFSVFWFVRPFSWEFEDWSYRLYLPLPILHINWDVENFELSLDVPWGCTKNIYQEDISISVGWNIIWINEYNEKYWNIRCRDETFMMTYDWNVEKDELWLYINFVKWTFDLDEDLLEALAVVWDWKFYYKDKFNKPSLLFLLWMLIFWWWFGALISKRYKNNFKKDDKYIIQYDAPKWVEPPEAGILIDDQLDPRDITSLIYRWASNRYIKICTEDEKNRVFYIKKLKELPENTKEYQKNLFKKLFSNWEQFNFSYSSTKFRSYLSQAETDLNKYVDNENWYEPKFSRVKLNNYSFKSWTKSFIFIAAFIWCLGYCFTVTGINETLNPVRSGITPIFWIWLIWIICSYRKKDKEQSTNKWIELRNHCLWYKEFLMKVDKKKIEELTKEDPLFVEKSLPYAVVFWIETSFIKKITPEMLSWYDGNLDSLLSSINYINKNTKIANYYTGGSSYSGGSHYSSSSWFSWGSSFSSWGFHSSWGGGWGGWRWW